MKKMIFLLTMLFFFKNLNLYSQPSPNLNPEILIFNQNQDPDFIPLVIAGIAFTATEVAGGVGVGVFSAYWLVNPPNIRVPEYMFRPQNVFSPQNPQRPKLPKNKLPTEKDFLLVALGVGSGYLIFKEGPGQNIKELYKNPEFRGIANILQERFDRDGYLVLPVGVKGNKTLLQRIIIKGTYGLTEEKNITLVNEGTSWTRISELPGGGIHRIPNYQLTHTEENTLYWAKRASPIAPTTTTPVENFRNVPTIRTIGGGGDDGDGDDPDDEYSFFDREEEEWDKMSFDQLGVIYREALEKCKLNYSSECQQFLARLSTYLLARLRYERGGDTGNTKKLIEILFGLDSTVPMEVYFAWCSWYWDEFGDGYREFYVLWTKDSPVIAAPNADDVSCGDWIKIRIVKGVPEIILNNSPVLDMQRSAKALRVGWPGINWEKLLREAPHTRQ